MYTGEWYIFGAKSTAIGVIRALRANKPGCVIKGCIVSSLMDNPAEIEGLKVKELREFAKEIPEEKKKDIQILIATPVYVQGEVRDTLKIFGFSNISALDTQAEARLMGDYYKSVGGFADVRSLSSGADVPKARVLMVRHQRDKVHTKHYADAGWVQTIWAGAAKEEERQADLLDSEGDSISEKNGLYRELTALYWLWKNLLEKSADEYDYYGLIQYKRVLDIGNQELANAFAAGVDVVLPYPMIHTPDIKEHHARYSDEEEWKMLLKAVQESAPEYLQDYERIFGQQYMYNYNMLIGKGAVILAYCRWLFPILFRTEELCEIHKIPDRKRYIAYFGESLLTWYFMHNADKLKIVHTGRLLRD